MVVHKGVGQLVDALVAEALGPRTGRASSASRWAILCDLVVVANFDGVDQAHDASR
jgi:hypothetical protein